MMILQFRELEKEILEKGLEKVRCEQMQLLEKNEMIQVVEDGVMLFRIYMQDGRLKTLVA